MNLLSRWAVKREMESANARKQVNESNWFIAFAFSRQLFCSVSFLPRIGETLIQNSLRCSLLEEYFLGSDYESVRGPLEF
jgi:hypothetical protein